MRTADRLSTLESMVGDLLAAVRGNLFPDVSVGKGWGSQPKTDYDERDRPRARLGSRVPWGTDDDADPRTERPYNVRTGRPTDQSRDPHTLDLQDRVYDNPPERTVERSLPVGVSPADSNRERLLREVLKELAPKGDFGATNGAPMDSEAAHEVAKGLLSSLFHGGRE